jgi:hypothetical protein
MILTLTEKRAITLMVMNSHNSLLSEAKYDTNIRQDIISNFVFYNAIKESFGRDVRKDTLLTEDLLSALGGIKDLLTGVDIVNKFVEWLTKKLLPKLILKIEQFIPGINELATKLGDGISKFIKWIKTNLSYDGLSKVFAMVKYRTFSPSTEQIKWMELAAKSAYRNILIAIVVAFLVKITGYSVDAVDSMINQANLFSGFDDLLAQVGIAKFISVLFGSYGSYTKADKAKKLKDDIEKKRDELGNEHVLDFSSQWKNACKDKVVN